eukprot:bmy_07199T0
MPGKKWVMARVLEKDHDPSCWHASSITAQKRSCNTATCVTHKMADWLSRSESVVKNNFMPTNVGSKAFGRRRSDLQA